VIKKKTLTAAKGKGNIPYRGRKKRIVAKS
jgi:hypothetical protein